MIRTPQNLRSICKTILIMLVLLLINPLRKKSKMFKEKSSTLNIWRPPLIFTKILLSTTRPYLR